jgi:hypothetical protein
MVDGIGIETAREMLLAILIYMSDSENRHRYYDTVRVRPVKHVDCRVPLRCNSLSSVEGLRPTEQPELVANQRPSFAWVLFRTRFCAAPSRFLLEILPRPKWDRFVRIPSITRQATAEKALRNPGARHMLYLALFAKRLSIDQGGRLWCRSAFMK